MVDLECISVYLLPKIYCKVYRNLSVLYSHVRQYLWFLKERVVLRKLIVFNNY